MVDPVVTGALVWLVQRLLDKGFDRVLDATFDSRGRSQPAVAPRRHDLSADGAHATSDIDVEVRNHVPAGRSPVLLTCQKFGTNTGGTTFPMVLGDTAHLTLRRDHYLIAALVVTLPRTVGELPVLNAVGWTHQWIADNHVRKITVTTQRPTEELVTELGLMKSDGSCPFILAVPYTEPVPPAATMLSDLGRLCLDLPELVRGFGQRTGVSSPQAGPGVPMTNRCRARTGLPNVRCPLAASADRLCRAHWRQANNGHQVHDYQTGARLWTS